jgi:Ca2+-binding RTX toxin-like protein
VLSGGDGTDQIFGGDGADTLNGDSGDDYLFGQVGSDTLNGGAGNDSLTGGEGNDRLDGGDGTDTANYSGNRSSYVIAVAGNGFSISSTAEGTDTLINIEYAQFEDQTIALNAATLDLAVPIVTSFRPSDDTTSVSVDENIRLTFNEGITRGTGNIILKNAAGQVIATYDAATSSNLSISDTTLTINPTSNLSYNTGYSVVFSAGSIKDLAGNSYAGATSYNFTTLSAAPLAGETFVAGAASVGYIGDVGNDTITGGAGNDWLFGVGADDVINGGEGIDNLYGGAGNDTLNGGAGIDALLGEDGNDILNGDAGNDLMYGMVGDDTLYGGDGVDNLYGGDGADTLNGGADVDALIAGDGNDLLDGGSGDDWMFGEAGDDTMYGGDGMDFMYGGTESDTLNGGASGDALVAGDGNDVLNGDGGGDWMFGEAGDDRLVGGTGNDTLYGGLGADTFVFAANQGQDILMDFSTVQGDHISIAAGTNGINTAADALLHLSTDVNGNAVLDLGDGNSVILAGLSVASLHAADFVIG